MSTSKKPTASLIRIRREHVESVRAKRALKDQLSLETLERLEEGRRLNHVP